MLKKISNLFLAIFILIFHINLSVSDLNPEQSFTKITQRPFVENEIKLNSSVVIVWEKCGVEARTRITKLFESVGYENQIILSYDPIINSLIFETVLSDGSIKKEIINLSEASSEILFFAFKDKKKILIYSDCPTISKTKLVWESEHIANVRFLKLFKNSESFANLDKALSVFMCRTRISILPGTLLHFGGIIPVANVSTLLFSFNKQSVSYSLNLQNDKINVISSNGTSSDISLNASIVPTNGLFFTFKNNGLDFFVACPYNNEPVGFWQTTLFDQRTQIETSRVHAIGSCSSLTLLHSFCHTVELLSEMYQNSSCLPVNQIENTLDVIESSNSYYTQFLPTKDVIEKIEALKKLNNLNLGELIDIEPRLLFASRDHAKPKFFDRPLVDYVDGFTDGSSNFWLGLETLHKITNAHRYKLRIVATSNDIDCVEEYNKFSVADALNNYTLSVGELNFGNNAAYFAGHDGTPFSTFDFGNKSLALKYSAGFWHKTFPDGIENYYCFSCEREYEHQNGSSVNVYLSSAYGLKIYTTKMYLVPTDSKPENYGLYQFEESSLLNHSMIDFLINSNAFYRSDRWKLIYRASTDGFASKNFHDKCNGKAKTLSIIKVANTSSIFGGYTNIAWDSTNNYRVDPGAYIFSLVNVENKPLVIRHKAGGELAIYGGADYGPTFGGGHDFYISNGANVNANSYANLAHNYKFELYPYGSVQAKNFLAGTYNFKVVEIEVFHKLN